MASLGRRRHARAARGLFTLQEIGNEEGEFDRLLGIEARIAGGIVAAGEPFRRDGAGAARSVVTSLCRIIAACYNPTEERRG